MASSPCNESFCSKNNLVRRVQLLIPTSKSELQRPIHKLVLLVAADDADDTRDSESTGIHC